MRVFITGATGFIGRHLCRKLVERGDQVTALVRSATKAASLPRGVESIQGDLELFSRPAVVLPPSDVVIHLAGVIAADTQGDYDAINHVATRRLVECLSRQSWSPRRLLLASSLAAAGPSPRGRAWTEQDPLQPIEAYGAAKARAETAVREAPFPTTCFRPPIVFGPDDDSTLTLFKAARFGFGIRVLGTPQELSFVDVRDLVDAILLMADDSRDGSFVYFTSHPRTMNTSELWECLGDAVGKSVAVLPVPRLGLYAMMRVSTVASKILRLKNQLDEKQYDQMVAPAFVCSSARLRSELGWKPQYDLLESLANAANGYRAKGRL